MSNLVPGVADQALVDAYLRGFTAHTLPVEGTGPVCFCAMTTNSTTPLACPTHPRNLVNPCRCGMTAGVCPVHYRSSR